MNIKKIEYTINENGCHICTSHCKDSWGYPLIQRNGKHGIKMHRFVFEKKYGYLPEVVMHTCDNPSCINPEHLKAGTHKENMKDRNQKNRQAKGKNHGRYIHGLYCK